MGALEGREKVVKGLEELREYADSEVHPILSPDNWEIYSELRDLIDEVENDVLALLKAQEPHVMTLWEIPERQEMTGWLEWRDGDFYAAILYANDLKVDYMKFCTSCAFMKSEYGKTVRCWTSRPTDEQREAVKWDD